MEGLCICIFKRLVQFSQFTGQMYQLEADLSEARRKRVAVPLCLVEGIPGRSLAA